MLCQVGIRWPEDACSALLLIVNRASVDGLPQVLRPVTPLGSQPPFGVGQSFEPLSPPLRSSLRFLPVLYPLHLSPHLRWGDSVPLALAEGATGLPRSAGCTNKRA